MSHDAEIHRFPSAAERMLRRSQRVTLEVPSADEREEYERVLNTEAEVISKAIEFLAWAEGSVEGATTAPSLAELPLVARELLDEARALRSIYVR